MQIIITASAMIKLGLYGTMWTKLASSKDVGINDTRQLTIHIPYNVNLLNFRKPALKRYKILSNSKSSCIHL